MEQIDLWPLWTEQLYKEYNNLLFHYRIKLPTPLLRIDHLKGAWGRWDPNLRCITINSRLIELYSWDIVLEVLKHEVAHQMVTDQFGGDHTHGEAFQRACDRLAVADWARKAAGSLPCSIPTWKERALDESEERLLRRVEKLLSLATSQNEHEAAVAMQKVREIYARHNLERIDARRQSGMTQLVINLRCKRVSPIETSILSVLSQYFFVQVIYCNLYDAKDCVDYKAVELIGTHQNLAMAEYVYHFLHQQLNSLWQTFQKTSGKSGRSRRSYMLGVLEGFSAKLAANEAQVLQNAASTLSRPSKELVAIADHELQTYVASRHPRLVSRRSRAGYADQESYAAGRKDGRQITLNRAITTTGSSGLYLP